MSNTPRTDEQAHLRMFFKPDQFLVTDDFAGQLEQELAEAWTEIGKLKVNLLAEESRCNLRLETKDTLIEQMRRALVIARSELVCADYVDVEEDMEIVGAALSAAEKMNLGRHGKSLTGCQEQKNWENKP